MQGKVDVAAWFRGPAKTGDGTGNVRETEDLAMAERTRREVEVQMACLSREELEEVIVRLAMKSTEARYTLSEVFERSSAEHSPPAPSKRPHITPLPPDSLSQLCSKYLPHPS